MVAHHVGEDIWRLNRGGHDAEKVYAAYHAAVNHKGRPTVILAKTVKGFGMGDAGEGQNITHQKKKLDDDDAEGVPRSLPHADLRRGDRELRRTTSPPEDSEEMKYLREPAREARRLICRSAASASSRCHVRRARVLQEPARRQRRPRVLDDDGVRANSARRSCATRASASTSCRSCPTKRVRSAWKACSARSASIRRWASSTRRRTPTSSRSTARTRRADSRGRHQRGRLRTALGSRRARRTRITACR